MNKRKVLEKQAQEIMDWFDFSKVAKVMELLDWKWGGEEGTVPLEGEIRSEVRKMMAYAIDEYIEKDRYGCGSGGFRIRIDEGEGKEGPWVRLSLAFVISDWDFDGEVFEE